MEHRAMKVEKLCVKQEPEVKFVCLPLRAPSLWSLVEELVGGSCKFSELGPGRWWALGDIWGVGGEEMGQLGRGVRILPLVALRFLGGPSKQEELWPVVSKSREP